MVDYYKILELEPDASQSEIKKSYYRLANKYHPDKSDYERAKELFTQITEAYKVLSNASRKREYDSNRIALEYSSSSKSDIFPIKKEKKPPPNPAKPPGAVLKEKGNTVLWWMIKAAMILSFLLSVSILLDVFMPRVVDTVVVTEKTQVNPTTFQLLTLEGEELMINSKFGNRIQLNEEIIIHHSPIFSRFFEIKINEWPYSLKIKSPFFNLMLLVGIVLISLSLIVLSQKAVSKRNVLLGVFVILLTIGQIALLISE